MPFDLAKWNALPEQTKADLRRVYTSTYRCALEHTRAMRNALAALQNVDKNAELRTNAILGQEQVEAIFGCTNPFTVDDDTLVTDKHTMLSFDDLDAMLEHKHENLEHIEVPGTHCLPHEF